ncbi:MAG: hypothetical protein H6713_42315 [Myxococcales bacterium]|nr:hypothetical protein [Myxococcales bacterium]MCB9756598.1 hypothetical protein [Myxococcales bacterium]
MSGSDDADKPPGLFSLLVGGDIRKPWADLEREHPRVVRAIWRWSIPALLVLAALDIWVHHHEHFGYDGIPGFYSFYGLFACVAMVVFSKKIIAVFLKRDDTYYDPEGGYADERGEATGDDGHGGHG